MKGLGAGYVNSWVEQYQDQPAPCIGQTLNANPDGSVNGLGPIGDCWLWLLVGAVAVVIWNSNKRKTA